MKIQSYKFFDLKFNTKYYSKIYEKVNLSESYPANLKRLQILLPLIQIKRIKLMQTLNLLERIQSFQDVYLQ